MLCFVVINNVVFWLSGLFFVLFFNLLCVWIWIGKDNGGHSWGVTRGILSVTFVKLPVDWQPAALFCTQNKTRWLTRTTSCRRCSSNCHLMQKALLYLLRKIHTPGIAFQHLPPRRMSFKPVLGVWESYEQPKYIGCRQVFLVFEKSTGRYLAKSASNQSLRCLRLERSTWEFVFLSTGQHSRARMQFRFKSSIGKAASFKCYLIGKAASFKCCFYR